MRADGVKERKGMCARRFAPRWGGFKVLPSILVAVPVLDLVRLATATAADHRSQPLETLARECLELAPLRDHEPGTHWKGWCCRFHIGSAADRLRTETDRATLLTLILRLSLA